MLKRRVLAVATAAVVSLGVGLLADGPQNQSSGSAAPATAASSSSKTNLYLEGCVFPKMALSGTMPSIVPVGTVEDYVLSDTKVLSAADGVDTSGVTLLQLAQVSQPRLRALIGKRVGVTGHVEAKPDLPVMDVTSIRPISGECPARPTARS